MIYQPLDPLLHAELRLAVMSLLISNVEAEFPYIKEQTGATAGNLSVQIDKLSAAQLRRPLHGGGARGHREGFPGVQAWLS